MINPTIKELSRQYIDLIDSLNDGLHDLDFARVKATALTLIIHNKYSILERECVDDPKKKMKNNATINALKAAHEPLDFRTFTKSYSEIKVAINQSYAIFASKINRT